jgi:hypothetical protein
MSRKNLPTSAEAKACVRNWVAKHANAQGHRGSGAHASTKDYRRHPKHKKARNAGLDVMEHHVVRNMGGRTPGFIMRRCSRSAWSASLSNRERVVSFTCAWASVAA